MYELSNDFHSINIASLRLWESHDTSVAQQDHQPELDDGIQLDPRYSVGQALGLQVSGPIALRSVDQITNRKTGSTLIALSVDRAPDHSCQILAERLRSHIKSDTSRRTGPDSDRVISRPGPRRADVRLSALLHGGSNL